MSAVGKNSLHRMWTEGDGDFDLHLIVYDDSLERFRNDAEYVTHIKGLKLKVIYKYLEANPQFKDKYDYFFFPDDDIFCCILFFKDAELYQAVGVINCRRGGQIEVFACIRKIVCKDSVIAFAKLKDLSACHGNSLQYYVSVKHEKLFRRIRVDDFLIVTFRDCSAFHVDEFSELLSVFLCGIGYKVVGQEIEEIDLVKLTAK